MISHIKRTSILVLLICSIFPVFAHAQNTLVAPSGAGTSANSPLVTCGGVDANGQEQPQCTTDDIFKLIRSILTLIFMFAGFIVAAMFMYAGFLLLTSQGNPGQISKAKNIFKRVVMGFVIMFLAYTIVKNLLTYIGATEFINIIR